MYFFLPANIIFKFKMTRQCLYEKNGKHFMFKYDGDCRERLHWDSSALCQVLMESFFQCNQQIFLACLFLFAFFHRGTSYS